MESRRVGQHALLVECADSTEVAATYAMLRARRGDLLATEIVPAARTVLLDGVRDPIGVQHLIAGWVGTDVIAADAGALVQIATRYDGADLDEVARQWETSTADVIEIHQGCEFVVVFCGFAPGFGYCTGLPHGLSVARRSEPRRAVPAGAVALAGEYTAVYPSSSPGGWQLIGTSTVPVWRPDQDQPALLTPGTRVRFVDA